MLQRTLDRLFRDDETLSPRMIVGSGLLAYALLFVKSQLGWAEPVAVLAIIVCLALISFSVLRALMPMMDPRDPDADRFAVWGSTALFLMVGGHGFGIWFLPGLVLGIVLIRWRAPELLEVLPGFGGEDEHEVKF